MKEKVLSWRDGSNGFCGDIGDSTSHPDYNVGDVIVYRNPYSDKKTLTKAVISKGKDGRDYPMGLGGTSMLDLCEKTEVILVVGYENITDDVLSDVNSALKLEEVDVIEMSQTQIEDKLGHRIRIVELR